MKKCTQIYFLEVAPAVPHGRYHASSRILRLPSRSAPCLIFYFPRPVFAPTPYNSIVKDADMEAEDLIDAKVPPDLLEGIKSSPSDINLVGKPMKARRPVASVPPVRSVPSVPSVPSVALRHAAEGARKGVPDAATGSASRSARPVAAAGGAAPVGRPMTRSRSAESQTGDADVIIVD